MMNELLMSLIIAVVQGITEWLPVSSSGHLVLTEKFLNYNKGIMFDVALHFGTLMAVFVYFGKDIVDIARDLIVGKWKSDNGKLGVMLFLATIPAGIIGFLFENVFEEVFNNLIIVGFGFAVTGILLMIASLNFFERRKRKFGNGSAFLVGVAQIFSLFPGVSRSGTTLSTSLILGLKEKDAMKFSFLLAVPIIFGANILAIGNKTLEPNLIWATLLSFFVGLIVLHVLYRYILTTRKNLRWFGAYALLMALYSLAWAFFG